jgi:general stress protein 26
MGDTQLQKDVVDYISKAKLAILATVKDGAVPALRTIGSFANDGLDVYFSTGRETAKVKQIEKNWNVAVYFQHDGQERPKFRYISVTGTAKHLTDDAAIKQAVDTISNRNPSFKQRIEKGELSKLSLFKVEAKSVKDLDFGRAPNAIVTFDI